MKETMAIKLDAYLLSKSTISLRSIRPAKINGNEMAVKKITSSLTRNKNQLKSGEIFRTVCGKFSFVCTYCDTNCKNGEEIVDHINSHFLTKQGNIEMSVPPALPEFVSINEIKQEPDMDIEPNMDTTPKIDTTVTHTTTNIAKNDRTTLTTEPTFSPTDSRIVRIIKRKKCTEPSLPSATLKLHKPEGSQIAKAVDNLKLPSTTAHSPESPTETRIVRIVKRPKCTKSSLPITALKLQNTEDSEMAKTVDNLKSPSSTARALKILTRNSAGTLSTLSTHSDDSPKTKIVKIVKLKRLSSGLRPIAKKKKILSFIDLTNEPAISESNIKPTGTSNSEPVVEEPHPQPSVEPPHPQPSVRPPHPKHVVEPPHPKHVVEPPHPKHVVEPPHPNPVVEQSHPQSSEVVQNLNVHTTPSDTKRMRLTKYTCYQCDMVPRVRNPNEHRRHKCLFCPVWFPNHAEFELHVREIHKKNAAYVTCKDFYCYVCEKRFDFRQYLTGHMSNHMEDRPFLCAFCGASHKTIGRLVEHEKTHDERRLFECDQCGKAFRRGYSLFIHATSHNTDLSFVCKICSKGFKAKRYLNRHMAVHDKPKIPCRHCDALFHFVSVRRAHEQKRHNVF